MQIFVQNIRRSYTNSNWQKNAGKIAFYCFDRRGTNARDVTGGRKIRVELESDLHDELGITPDEMRQTESE